MTIEHLFYKIVSILTGGCVVKILCVLFPHFPYWCEAQNNPAVKRGPFVIMYSFESQKLVLDASPELEGIKRDMTLQQALAINGQVALIQADVPRYWSVFNGLLDILEEKSPLVEGTELGCAYLGLDGLESIYRSDDILATRVREAIPAVFPIRMGIAGGKFPAYLAAMNSRDSSCRKFEGKIFFKDMPCDILPISAKSKERLHDFGIHTLGQATSFPIGPLQAQFGPEGKTIYELARGQDDTPLIPRRWEETIEESTTLSSVTVSLEVLLITAEALFARFFARDLLNGRGIRSLILWTQSPGAGHWERSVRFRELAMDVKSAISRVKFTLERYPQPGPVEEMGFRITGLGYRRGRQWSLFAETRAKDNLLADIKDLELRRGAPEVFKIKEVEPWSRIPERRYVLAPVNR